MKRRVSIRPEAQADIKEAASWYESRERGLGIRFKLEARTAFRRIGDNALMFPAIDTRVRRALFRSFPYSVFFTVEEKEVVILAVLHQHRHPDIWKTRP
jgi:plasmid stabilization system protein ParE